MTPMKKLLCALLALLLLCGCGAQAPQEMTLDESFVIVCAEDTALSQAALSLQSNLKHSCGLELELVTEAPGEGKTITVSVDSALEAGQYRTRLTEGGVVIEAQNVQVMTLAMRSICANWPGKQLLAGDCSTLSGVLPLAEAPFLVLTQNIRYADDEGGNLVIQRAPRFNQLVQQYQPDILCIQEDNRVWAPILEKFFSDRYGFTGMYSGGPDKSEGKGGNKQLIFFRSDRYELLEEGGFWLSDTPEEASKLEDSKSIRSCTWALLRDLHTGKELFVCNTHLDTQSEEVRVAQLNILLEQVGSYIDKYPTVFCGDFNASPDSDVYAQVTTRFSDPHVTAASADHTAEYTYTNYDTEEDPKRLDYLFYNDSLIAQSYRIMTDTYDGYISDHFGAMTEYSFSP